MNLPAYAEELKRLVEEGLATHSIIGGCAVRHIDRILRDAEIAQAAREFANTPDRALVTRALKRDALLALIAKETP